MGLRRNGYTVIDCLVFDLSITDSVGRPMCTMTGFELARHFISIAPPDLPARYDLIYEHSERTVDRFEVLLHLHSYQ